MACLVEDPSTKDILLRNVGERRLKSILRLQGHVPSHVGSAVEKGSYVQTQHNLDIYVVPMGLSAKMGAFYLKSSKPCLVHH